MKIGSRFLLVESLILRRQPMRKNLFLLISLVAGTVYGTAQSAVASDTLRLSYPEFLSEVKSEHLNFAAKKYDVDIARAEAQAAKALPDPELSFTAFDNQQRRLKMGYGFEAELSWEVELGGKRKARKNLAAEKITAAEWELQSFFQELRQEASENYLEALKNKARLEALQHSRSWLKTIKKFDSKLLNDRIQALENEIEESREELNDSLEELAETIGGKPIFPVGNLQALLRNFTEEDLLQTAQHRQTELLASRQKLTVAEREISVAKADRVPDLGVMIGVENNSFAKNIIGPNPGHTVAKAGISIPIAFSNKYDAGVKTAQYQEKQAQLEHLALLRKTERRIRVAYRKLTQQQELLEKAQEETAAAQQLFDRTVARGSNDLQQMLAAEENCRQKKLAEIDAIARYNLSVVELETAVGIWDIDF